MHHPSTPAGDAHLLAQAERFAREGLALAAPQWERERRIGREALRESQPFGRHLAGARVASFVDGSSEMLLERIAALQRGASSIAANRAKGIPEHPEA